MNESPIAGNVSVKYADYQVLIQLVGTIDKPQILLKSDPPLPENQIIAVLIFGRPLDELDSDQTASVGSTQAAITDGAISLASLYLLASTPIQSVNYDPSSGAVSAKVRLGDGMSLNLGRSTQESTIGIRKRIGRYWTLETDFSNSAPYGKVGSAYLEWSHRY
jgi:autotransporter translocation and assembly factor TamB